MLLSVVLKPFLRISKINLQCFQNKFAVFLKLIRGISKINLQCF